MGTKILFSPKFFRLVEKKKRDDKKCNLYKFIFMPLQYTQKKKKRFYKETKLLFKKKKAKINWREERGRQVTSHRSPSPSPIFSSIPPTKISHIFFSQSNILPYHFLFIFLSLIFYLLIFTFNQMHRVPSQIQICHTSKREILWPKQITRRNTLQKDLHYAYCSTLYKQGISLYICLCRLG